LSLIVIALISFIKSIKRKKEIQAQLEAKEAELNEVKQIAIKENAKQV
jgi:hypothetical protein